MSDLAAADFQALESYDFEDQLPQGTRRKLKEIFASWSDTQRAETLVREIRVWMQSLVAYSYNMVWLGEAGVALAALDKILVRDPEGKCGARRQRDVMTQPARDAGLVFSKDHEDRRYPDFQSRRVQDI